MASSNIHVIYFGITYVIRKSIFEDVPLHTYRSPWLWKGIGRLGRPSILWPIEPHESKGSTGYKGSFRLSLRTTLSPVIPTSLFWWCQSALHLKSSVNVCVIWTWTWWNRQVSYLHVAVWVGGGAAVASWHWVKPEKLHRSHRQQFRQMSPATCYHPPRLEGWKGWPRLAQEGQEEMAERGRLSGIQAPLPLRRRAEMEHQV